MTTITKLTTPVTTRVSFIGGEFQQPRVWIIFGEGYTTSDAVTAYAQRAGYELTTVDAIPDEYTQQVARLKAWPDLLGQGHEDGADPEQIFMRDNPRTGRPVDIRDILNGTATH